MSIFAATPLFLIAVLVSIAFLVGWVAGRGTGYSAGCADVRWCAGCNHRLDKEEARRIANDKSPLRK